MGGGGKTVSRRGGGFKCEEMQHRPHKIAVLPWHPQTIRGEYARVAVRVGGSEGSCQVAPGVTIDCWCCCRCCLWTGGGSIARKVCGCSVRGKCPRRKDALNIGLDGGEQRIRRVICDGDLFALRSVQSSKGGLSLPPSVGSDRHHNKKKAYLLRASESTHDSCERQTCSFQHMVSAFSASSAKRHNEDRSCFSLLSLFSPCYCLFR